MIETKAKAFSEQDVEALAATHYGIKGVARKLNGEIDLNFHIKDLQAKSTF